MARIITFYLEKLNPSILVSRRMLVKRATKWLTANGFDINGITLKSWQFSQGKLETQFWWDAYAKDPNCIDKLILGAWVNVSLPEYLLFLLKHGPTRIEVRERQSTDKNLACNKIQAFLFYHLAEQTSSAIII